MRQQKHKGRDKKEQKPEAELSEKNPVSQFKRVRVLRSKCGYEGEGELIGPAYGDKFLVKIDADGFNKIITVKKTDIK